MRIIHISDFHLRDPGGSENAAQHANFLAACLRELAEKFSDTAYCVVTGDLADDGDPAAYRWLRDQLESLPFPTIPLLGNHDDREAFLREFGDQGRDQNGFVQSEVNTADAKLIFLDTVKSGSDAGTLCEARLNWLKTCLQTSGDQPVLLFMHHPPCKIGDPNMDPIMLDNAEAFEQVLQQAGNVQHIFFGHVHRSIFVNWKGLPATSLRGPQSYAEGSQTKYTMTACIVDLEGEALQITTVTLSQVSEASQFQGEYPLETRITVR
ncbi:MAG: phosphodiesterase [Rhodobacteraceae bacterium]|nr:phosphodiesterase [Paracoccaceae bacterium]